MNEAQWLAHRHSLWMLRFLGAKASGRKLRLFGCACCRRIWSWLISPRDRAAVEVCERYADGEADENERAAAMIAARDGQWQGWGILKRDALQAARAGLEAALALTGAKAAVAKPWPAARDARAAERASQAALLRCIFGNPFRAATLDTCWLAWNDGTVRKMAQAIYDARAFDRLPLLADALEEAGCADAAILAHCREPGEHVRGCWVVDLLLGKE